MGNPNTLWSMSGLAEFYYNLGQYQKAEDLFRQTVELQKKYTGG